MNKLTEFVIESNRIEGIMRAPTEAEIGAHEHFLALVAVTLLDLEEFVGVVAKAQMRRKAGMDVRVGNHFPPRGGPSMHGHVDDLLISVNKGSITPYAAHVRYETLHPFMDGNGRSGRALWAWMMAREYQDPFALPFLHRFYYQALDGARS